MEFIAKLPWGMLILVCLTLGLAPFCTAARLGKTPDARKRQAPSGPLTGLTSCCTSTPWVLLIIKVIVSLVQKG